MLFFYKYEYARKLKTKLYKLETKLCQQNTKQQ